MYAQVKDEYGSKDVQSTIDQATHLTKTSGARHLLLYRFKPANGQVTIIPGIDLWQ